MATDLATTTGTSASPVVTSASYNFVARDEGHWLYIGAGTNWIPGWYQIFSTSGNAATLTATAGAGRLSVNGMPSTVTTATGVATQATPGGNGTWSIDYSQGTALAITDAVVGGTTTQYTSTLTPVGKNFVGNIFNVVSGATVQRVQIVSTSTITATCDKTLGTAAQTAVGNIGGPLATPGLAGSLKVGSNTVFIQAATYSCSSSSNVAGGRVTDASGCYWIGWNTIRTISNTDSTRPTLNATANSMTVFTASTLFGVRNLKFGKSTSETSVTGFSSTASNCFIETLTATAITTGFTITSGVINIYNCNGDTCATSFSVASAGTAYLHACTAKANTSTAFTIGGNGSFLNHCIAANGSGIGFNFVLNGSVCVNCVSYGNTGASSHGFQFNTGGGNHLLINCVSVGNGGTQFFKVTSTQDNLRAYACYAKADGAGTDNLLGFEKMGLTTLTADPFVDGANGNFTPNATSGGGAAIRGTGFPGVFPGLSSTGYIDAGAVQSGLGAPSAGSGGGHVLGSSIIQGLGAI